MSDAPDIEPRVEPKFRTLGRLTRPTVVLGRSILERCSTLVRDSGKGGACDMLDVRDLQPFKMDFRTLCFSFSGGGGGSAVVGGCVGRGMVRVWGLGEGADDGEEGRGGYGARRVGYGDSWSKCKRSSVEPPLKGRIWAATMGPGLVERPLKEGAC